MKSQILKMYLVILALLLSTGQIVASECSGDADPVSCKQMELKSAFKTLSIEKRREIQIVLSELGFYNSSIDGLYGKGTAAALLSYQEQNFSNLIRIETSTVRLLGELLNEVTVSVLDGQINENCASTARKCTETELCAKAVITFKNGKKIWTELYSKHVAEAKIRGLGCGVNFTSISNQKTCGEDVKLCGASYLCAESRLIISSGETLDNSPHKASIITEARRRELACIPPAPVPKTCYNSSSMCSDSEICSRATFKENDEVFWVNSIPATKRFKDEAKRRLLKCGVRGNSPESKKSCTTDPKLCTITQLCSKASKNRGNEKVWRTTSRSARYVSEAQRNGVSCGVQTIAAKPTAPPKDTQTYKVASGSGFYVSEGGHIVTNHHVIDGCKTMKIQAAGKVWDTIFIASDPQHDLALLQVNKKPAHVFSLSTETPFPTQDIIVAGFPFGDRYSSALKFTQGIISAVIGVGNNYSQIQIDAALQPGNSGGPIMDEYGNIVGVAVAKLSLKKVVDEYGVVPENTNFGVKASAVKNLMEGNRVPFKKPNSEADHKSNLSRMATDGTVHLTCWMTKSQIEEMKKRTDNRKVLFSQFETE